MSQPVFEANEIFLDKQNQRVLVRKLFSLLSGQFLCLAGLVYYILYSDWIRRWAFFNYFLLLVSLVLFIILIISLFCSCRKFPRAFPGNILSLILFTILEGILLGSLASVFECVEVLLTVGILSYLCLTLILYTVQSRLDFTTLKVGFFAAFCLFPIIILLLYYYQYPILTVLISGLMALAVCLNFTFFTHRMMNYGSLCPSEWIFAALKIHLDILTCRCFCGPRNDIGN